MIPFERRIAKSLGHETWETNRWEKIRKFVVALFRIITSTDLSIAIDKKPIMFSFWLFNFLRQKKVNDIREKATDCIKLPFYRNYKKA